MLSAVSTDLRTEAAVIRGQSSPDVGDESAFAFAGLALDALGRDSEAAGADESAADSLAEVADSLETLVDGHVPAADRLAELEQIFLRASDMASSNLGHVGDFAEGAPVDALTTS